jgi:hypothetical protein
MRGAASRAASCASVALLPSVAAACPVCARDNTPIAVLLIAGMIAAPYVVALVVIRAIRGGGVEP